MEGINNGPVGNVFEIVGPPVAEFNIGGEKIKYKTICFKSLSLPSVTKEQARTARCLVKGLQGLGGGLIIWRTMPEINHQPAIGTVGEYIFYGRVETIPTLPEETWESLVVKKEGEEIEWIGMEDIDHE